jgi:putative DNA methylase
MTGTAGSYRPKLIEAAIPVTEISKASLADKNRKVGTIKNLHKWFAPMPTPALRAVIFSALVDEPDDPADRSRLIELVKKLVPDNGMPPPDSVLREAELRIQAANPDLPVVIDPFAGAGSTLVEAQRLGLAVAGSDLNPVAVLITRTLVELLPPLAVALPVSPVGPVAHIDEVPRKPFEGLIADLRYYGDQVQQAVKQKLAEVYPSPPSGMAVAWLWARTVPCPNPACGVTVPLFSSPWLSKQKGREATVEVIADDHCVRVVLHRGAGAPGSATKIAGRARFACPRCAEPFGEKEIRDAASIKRLGYQLLASCVDTDAGRIFLPPDEVPGFGTELAVPEDLDDLDIGANTKNFSTGLYGLTRHTDLYTSRQLVMLATFADEVAKVYDLVVADGGGRNHARALASLLGLCVGKLAQSNSTLVRWRTRQGPSKAEPAFGNQSIPMLWDFAEAYPFGESVGSWNAQIDSVAGVLPNLPVGKTTGRVIQADARTINNLARPGMALVVTDPPYFGQINYADLSDYFYSWLRRALRNVHPDLFATMATPKVEELVANPVRHDGSMAAARQYFIDGFTEVFSSFQKASRPDLPMLVVYAHKQDEQDEDGVISTGWEALLEAVLASGLSVVGTWPIEASSANKMIGQGANALASYIILVCRPRPVGATATDRRGLIAALREEVPGALTKLQQVGIAPVDLAQASIGPGMAVFSRYGRVNEPDGSAMRVRTALALINQVLDEVLSEQEGDFGSDTRWCVEWFKSYGFDEGPFGVAEALSKAKNTAIQGLENAGVLRSRAGKVRLLSVKDLSDAYDPAADDRVSEWEIVLHLAKRLHEQGGEAAARLMVAARDRVGLDAVKELAYLLFSISEKRGWTETALLFNGLGTSWSELASDARKPALAGPAPLQGQLGFDTEEA